MALSVLASIVTDDGLQAPVCRKALGTFPTLATVSVASCRQNALRGMILNA